MKQRSLVVNKRANYFTILAQKVRFSLSKWKMKTSPKELTPWTARSGLLSGTLLSAFRGLHVMKRHSFPSSSHSGYDGSSVVRIFVR